MKPFRHPMSRVTRLLYHRYHIRELSTSFDCFGLPQTLTPPSTSETDEDNSRLILTNMTLNRWGVNASDIDPKNPSGAERKGVIDAEKELPDHSPALAMLDR